jgi:hypothetical protein
MLGGWWFSASPSSPDNQFLRVANAAFPNRRLSDNTLMTPKIRIAPSCASSPGGTPGGGLPIRRHSSIGPQERRGSAINLSPPTVSTLFKFKRLNLKVLELIQFVLVENYLGLVCVCSAGLLHHRWVSHFYSSSEQTLVAIVFGFYGFMLEIH